MRGDSLEAWERQLRHTCGACGMRSLSVDPRCCDLVEELTLRGGEVAGRSGAQPDLADAGGGALLWLLKLESKSSTWCSNRAKRALAAVSIPQPSSIDRD